MEISEVLKYLGEFGTFQLYVYIICSIPSIINGMFMLSNVFVMGSSGHRCFIKGCDENGNDGEKWYSFTIPRSATSQSLSQCLLYKRETSNSSLCDASLFSKETAGCNQWVHDPKPFLSTVISEWDLVCDRSWMVPFSQSIFMVGVLFGAAITGSLADKYGRRSVFCWAPFVAVSGCIGASFAPNIVVYTIMTAFTSACTAGMFQTAFIIGIELIGPSLRTWCGNIQQMLFACGELLLCFMAYNVRDWRRLEFTMVLPMLSLLSLPWILPESIRWQAANGHSNKAVKTIKKAAYWNRVYVPTEALMNMSDSSPTKTSTLKKLGWTDLFKNRTLRRWSLNLFFNWIVNSLVYYGLSLEAGSMGTDPYSNFAWLAAIEIPAIILGTITMQLFGRRKVLSGFLLLGGLACISPVAIPIDHLWLVPYMAVVGKGAISATFALIYVYSVEIYPTVLRSTGLGFCSMFSRIGAILAPHLSFIRIFGNFAPLYFCGILATLAGILALDLPETHNKVLPDTIEDINAFRYAADILTLSEASILKRKISNRKKRGSDEGEHILGSYHI